MAQYIMGDAGQRDAPAVRGSVMLGGAIVVAFFGGLGTWAALAPLDSAAIAPGTVSVDSNRKTIQHLEGGIVGEILVRDGDVVAAGQPLIRLDETRPRATLDLLTGRRIATEALASRLAAERDGRSEIKFPDWLLDRVDDPKVAETVAGQRTIFRARREALEGATAIQRQRIAQLNEQIRGLEGEIRAEDAQLRLIRVEAKDVKALVAKGLARRPRLLALQRQQAEIEGGRSRNRAAIAEARQSIGEARIRIGDLRTQMLNDVVQQHRDAQSELFDLAERIRAADDVLTRTEVRAPLAGTVVGLQVHTPGGVIGPGEKLMDIVPSGDRLVIEARVDPNDIDVVHPGLAAEVRLTAFSRRRTLPVAGEVTSVSADRLVDERSGRPYYLARVRLTGDVARQLNGATLYPGMPAEVMIATGARTALDYIFKPISTSLDRAFREQ